MTSRLALAAALLSGCAASQAPTMPSYEPAAAVADAPAPPPSLDRSLFQPRGTSGLTEAEIGQILDAPVELKLPARVGVVALGAAFTPSSPASLDAGLAATRAVEQALEGSRLVTLATEMTGQLPTGPGIEGLRELAARYRVPYLLLYTERFEDRSRTNGWAAMWLTLVGGFFAPSRTVEGVGLAEISLLDVRTGTLLFTVQEPLRFSERRTAFGAERAFAELERKAADAAAAPIAERVLDKLRRASRAAEPSQPAKGTAEAAAPRPGDV